MTSTPEPRQLPLAKLLQANVLGANVFLALDINDVAPIAAGIHSYRGPRRCSVQSHKDFCTGSGTTYFPNGSRSNDLQ